MAKRLDYHLVLIYALPPVHKDSISYLFIFLIIHSIFLLLLARNHQLSTFLIVGGELQKSKVKGNSAHTGANIAREAAFIGC